MWAFLTSILFQNLKKIEGGWYTYNPLLDHHPPTPYKNV